MCVEIYPKISYFMSAMIEHVIQVMWFCWFLLISLVCSHLICHERLCLLAITHLDYPVYAKVNNNTAFNDHVDLTCYPNPLILLIPLDTFCKLSSNMPCTVGVVSSGDHAFGLSCLCKS